MDESPWKNWKPPGWKTRKALFEILGGMECVCQNLRCPHKGKCGYNNVSALCFDHIFDNGHEIRAKIPDTVSWWKYYVNDTELAKKELQVFCFNCNQVKRLRY